MTFKDKVIYQIYPKSFKDSNNDGIGDLKGIISKLPYLKKLGIDMIWLNPIFPSPQNDNGYDIADYCKVDPIFGSMADLEELIEKAKALDIDLMFDMVFNHVSTSHEWFQKALSGDKRYQDYFILRDQPTNWVSKFGGNAWATFGDTGRYYLHLFDLTQADLNWRNPEVRQELTAILNFWLEKGIKGFRFDVINVIGKDEELKDNAENEGKMEYTDKPIIHDYLQELNAATFGQVEDIITVGEMSSTTIENCILYTKPERHELSMAFNFHHLKVDYENKQKWTLKKFDFEELKDLLHTWGEKISEGDGWNALFWNNHDQPRALNRFVDIENYRVEGAKMLATAIHLSRGTPYIYMGEEIGMVDPVFASIEEYVDVESKNAYQELLNSGKSAEEAFQIVQVKSRDNSRTPMQWEASAHAGFSQQKPWLGVGAYEAINVEQELKNGSIFQFYQKLIQLRKSYSVISEGSYRGYQKAHASVYAYIREYQQERLLCLNNFSNEEVQIDIPAEFVGQTVLLSNYPCEEIRGTMRLAPYQTLAIYTK